MNTIDLSALNKCNTLEERLDLLDNLSLDEWTRWFYTRLVSRKSDGIRSVNPRGSYDSPVIYFHDLLEEDDVLADTMTKGFLEVWKEFPTYSGSISKDYMDWASIKDCLWHLIPSMYDHVTDKELKKKLKSQIRKDVLNRRFMGLQNSNEQWNRTYYDPQYHYEREMFYMLLGCLSYIMMCGSKNDDNELYDFISEFERNERVYMDVFKIKNACVSETIDPCEWEHWFRMFVYDRHESWGVSLNSNIPLGYSLLERTDKRRLWNSITFPMMNEKDMSCEDAKRWLAQALHHMSKTSGWRGAGCQIYEILEKIQYNIEPWESLYVFDNPLPDVKVFREQYAI